MERGRWTFSAVLGAIAIGAVVVGTLWLMNRPERATTGPGLSPFAEVLKPRDKVPVMFDAPAFDFTDQNGQRAQNTELRGKVWVADFIFTHCAGACPKVTAKFVELQ